MENSSATFTLLELFFMGGPIMWPLLLFSIIVVAIVLERAIYLLYHNLKMDDLREKVESAIISGNLAGAKEYLESQTKRRMGARILLTLVNRSGYSEHRLEKAVEAEAAGCITSLKTALTSSPLWARSPRSPAFWGL